MGWRVKFLFSITFTIHLPLLDTICLRVYTKTVLLLRTSTNLTNATLFLDPTPPLPPQLQLGPEDMLMIWVVLNLIYVMK